MGRLKGWKRTKNTKNAMTYVHQVGREMQYKGIRNSNIIVGKETKGKYAGKWEVSFTRYYHPAIHRLERCSSRKGALNIAIDWMKKHPNG